MLKFTKKFLRRLWELRPKTKPTIVATAIFGAFALFICVFWASPALAQVDDLKRALLQWVGEVALTVAELCIRLMIFFLSFFIELARFNDYIDLSIVMLGWTMVRDVANMFFVVVLLVIAVGTILGIEQYQWNKTLVKLILAAVFINFSNLICGIFIDVAHVFTITFLNAISATAGGNLINMFHLNDMFTLVTGQTPATDEAVKENMDLRILAAAIAALLFAGLSLITMVVYCAVMLYRVVILWVLIILSPIAYITSALPQGQSYSKEWWDEFTKHVLVAPLMVFFLWLAFATMGEGQIAAEMDFKRLQNQQFSQEGQMKGADPAATQSKITEWMGLANLLIPIAFLWVGLERVQKLGVRGGDMVGKGMDFFKKAATVATGVAAGRWMAKKGWEGGKAVTKWGLMNAPIVGGKSWIRRGKFVQEKALGAADWWNQGLGALTNLQFGGHEKIMKNRQLAIEQRKARISSSAKGWLKGGKGKFGGLASYLGKKVEKIPILERGVGGIEKFRKYRRELEGEGEQRKTRSGYKETYEKAKGAMDYHYKDGERTEESLEMGRRVLKSETAQAQINTAQVGGKLEIMTSEEEGNRAVADKNIHARVKSLEAENAFSGVRKEKEGKFETKELQEAREREERAVEGVKTAHAPEVARIKNVEEQKAVVEKANKRDAEAKKLEEDAQKERDDAATKGEKKAKVTAEMAKFDTPEKQGTDEYKKLKAQEEQINKDIEEHQNKAKESDRQAKETRGEGGGEGGEGWQERMLALLTQINQGVREPLKGGPEGLFAQEAAAETAEADRKSRELEGIEQEKQQLERSGKTGDPRYTKLSDDETKLTAEMEAHRTKAKDLKSKSDNLDRPVADLMADAAKERQSAELKKQELKNIGAKKAKLEEDKKTDSDEYKQLTSDEAAREKDIKKHEANAEELEKEALTKQMQETATKGGAGLDEKAMELLEKISKGVNDTNKSTQALQEIENDGDLKALFGQMFAGKQLDTNFIQSKEGKNSEKLLDYMKDKKKVDEARKFIADEGNKGNYTKDMETLLSATEAALKKLAVDQKGGPFSAAYFKVKSDEVAGSKTKAQGILEEGIFQKVVADRRHVRSPSDAFDTEIARLQKSMGKKEKEGLMTSAEALARSIVSRREKGGAKYDESQAGRNDHIWLLALASELKKQKYLDDKTGMGEKITIDQINRLGASAGMGEEDQENFVRRSDRIAEKANGERRSSAHGNPQEILGRIGGNLDQRKYLQEIHQNLEVHVPGIQQKLETGGALNRDDLEKINRFFVSNYGNKNLGFDQTELLAVLQGLKDDNALRRSFNEFTKK